MPNQVKRIMYARDKVAKAITELEKGAANRALDDEHFHPQAAGAGTTSKA